MEARNTQGSWQSVKPITSAQCVKAFFVEHSHGSIITKQDKTTITTREAHTTLHRDHHWPPRPVKSHVRPLVSQGQSKAWPDIYNIPGGGGGGGEGVCYSSSRLLTLVWRCVVWKAGWNNENIIEIN